MLAFDIDDLAWPIQVGMYMDIRGPTYFVIFIESVESNILKREKLENSLFTSNLLDEDQKM